MTRKSGVRARIGPRSKRIVSSKHKIAEAYLTKLPARMPHAGLIFQWEEKSMAEVPARKKVTINTLMAKMKKGEPITQLAAYDYRTAVVADRLGIDILCVSDTGGMILFGH